MGEPGDRKTKKDPDCLTGTVVSGTGEVAYFVALGWVREEIRRVAGFDPYPGTLNLRLLATDASSPWSGVRKAAGARLTPPEPGACGGRLIPVLVQGRVEAAVVVPDVTRYGDEVLEIIAPVHLRSCLGLRDGDPVRLTLTGGGHHQWPTI